MTNDDTEFDRPDIEAFIADGSFDPDAASKFHLTTEMGEAWVSTVRLPCDHSFGSGRPVWYETMIRRRDEPIPSLDDNPFTNPEYRFVSTWYDMQWRYHTEAEARAGHAEALRRLTTGEDFGDTLFAWRDGQNNVAGRLPPGTL